MSANSTDWTVETSREFLIALVMANDKRYEQRFDASQKALELGFAVQKDAINAAFAAQKDAVKEALTAADRAVQKAELATEKRFESVNEFRSTLSDQQRTFMPRSEVEVTLGAIRKEVDAVSKLVDRAQAERQGIKGGWGYAAGAAGLVLTLLALASRFWTP